MEIFDESNSIGEDYVLSGLGADGFVRILAAQTTNLVQKAADIQTWDLVEGCPICII